MKFIFSVVFLVAFLFANCQVIVTPEGEFMDTTIVRPLSSCDSAVTCYYYNFSAKYPKNSATLLYETQRYMEGSKHLYAGSGYITFRVQIDCNGHQLKKVQVLQTDESYQSYHFDKSFVNDLYGYFRTLNEWRVADYKVYKFSYMTFITFKICNGKVINIIP